MLVGACERLVRLRQTPRGRAQRRHRPLQLPAQRRRHRHRRVPVGVRVALQHARRDEGRGLRRGGAGHGRGAARARPRRQRRALRHRRQRARAHQRRRPRAPGAAPRGDREAVGPGARANSRATARRSSSSARSSAASWSASSPPLATRATRCGSSSSRALRRRTRSRPSTATCARTSRRTRSSTSARTARWSSCPASRLGMSEGCWPDRLIGDLPNLYLYAANNPSEGALARRRSAATLISYLTPPVTQAGLYRGLLALRESLDRLRALPPGDAEAARLLPLDPGAGRRAGAGPAEPRRGVGRREHADPEAHAGDMAELEQTLIPCGLHVVGEPMPAAARAEYLAAIAEGTPVAKLPEPPSTPSSPGATPQRHPRRKRVCHDDRQDAGALRRAGADQPAALRRPRAAGADARARRRVHPAGAGRRPACATRRCCRPGATCTASTRSPSPAPSPSLDGARAGRAAAGAPHRRRQRAARVGRAGALGRGQPQVRAAARSARRSRCSARARASTATAGSCGAELIPLEELGRPRIDVLITLSGIFRDLLPLQTRLLAEAAFLAASADEPLEQNFVRRHALAHQQKHGCDLETAALRVFSNGDGAYGANVNQLIDSGAWEDEDELAEAYSKRKCFAYGRSGAPVKQEELLKSVLAGRRARLPEPESVELGVTTRRPLLRHARRHRPRGAAREGRRRRAARLHRRPDARRGQGAHAHASRSRSRAARAR